MNWNPLCNEGLRIKVDRWSSNWKIRIYSSDGHFEPRVILARIMLFWIGKKKNQMASHYHFLYYFKQNCFPRICIFLPFPINGKHCESTQALSSHWTVRILLANIHATGLSCHTHSQFMNSWIFALSSASFYFLFFFPLIFLPCFLLIFIIPYT